MWTTSKLTWISLGNDVWVRVDQIEGVWLDPRRRVVVKAISGGRYVAEEGLTMKEVFKRMTKEGQ